MVRSKMLVWEGLVPLLLTTAAAAGEAVEWPTVDRGRGCLAVRSDGQAPWRIVDEGTRLPSDCLLRTAAAGPCRVHLPGCTLLIDSDSRLALEAGKLAVSLQVGRFLLETDAEKSWSARLGARQATVAPASAAELTLNRDGSGRVHVVRGSVTAGGTNGDSLKLAEGQATDWSAKQAESLATTQVAESDREQVPGWADLDRRPQGLGQLLVKDAQSGERRRLNVARYHAHVVLQPPVALVQIDQSFYNPYDGQEEGTFVFNLPQGASVSRFAMYVERDKLMEGELVERRRAADIYRSIVNQRRDPAILEQIGDNLFRMRVFPIFAKKTKRILLDYTIPLNSRHGEYRFQLPLLSDLEPIWDFRLSGVVRGPVEDGSLVSLTHGEMRFERRDDGSFGFEMARRSFQPETDFRLSFRQPSDDGARLQSQLAPPLPLSDSGAGLWNHPWGQRSATYFLASIPAELQAERGNESPADVLILADTSSGMAGTGLVRDSLRTIVHNLRAEDRLRLMAVDIDAREIHEGWVGAGSQAEEVLARFDSEFCLGGTDLATSFTSALKSFDDRPGDRRRLVIYIGDGKNTEPPGREPNGLIADVAAPLKKAGATFVGVHARRTLAGEVFLNGLARSTGGLTFDLAGERSGHRELFRWLLGGLAGPEKVERVDVDGAADEDLFFPTAWMPGKPLRILGRLPWTDTVRLKLTTSRNGRKIERQWELESPNDAEDIFIGRLWAQKKLDELRRQKASDGDVSGATLNRILNLSQEWSLLTPYTAFLVLESEKDYERWGVDRRVRRRYWKPADALAREPLPHHWLARVTPDLAERRRESEAKRVARAMETAREALAAENYTLAFGILQAVRELGAATDREDFAQLYRRAESEVRLQNLLESLGPHRGLFDLTERGKWSELEPSLAPLVMHSLDASGEFLRRHPHARELLAEVAVEPRKGQWDGFCLQEIADTLAAVTGTNIVFDHRALEDRSVNPREPLDIYFFGKLSVRNYARCILAQCGLVMIEEPNRILITTEAEAELRLSTDVYPVADLYLKDRMPQLESLANPYLDRDRAAEARIRTNLKRPINVEFEETPLGAVVRHVAEAVDVTVLVDEKAMDDAGVGLDSPVTANWKHVPGSQALKWILESLDLDYYVADEALVISTPEEKELQLETQLQSGRGIVYEYPVPSMLLEKARYLTGTGFRLRHYGTRMMGGMGGQSVFSGGGMGSGGGFGGGLGGSWAGGMGGLGGYGGGLTGGSPGSGNDIVLGLDPALASEAEAENEPAAADSGLAFVEEPQDAEPAAPAAQEYVVDSETIVGQVTATIVPDSWEDVGGPGSLGFFSPTLDFVFLQTDDVHEQIEALFTRMRSLPKVWSDPEMQPAKIRSVDPDNPLAVDLDELVDLIVATVEPYEWEDVGGPGSIQADLPRLALAIRATQDTHERVYRLLTMLRRSRYAAVEGTRPWETAAGTIGGASAGGKALGALSVDSRPSDLPEPEAVEMEALRVRRAPDQGRWRWRYFDSENRSGTEFEIRLAEGKMEIFRPDVRFRVVEDEAAIAYTGLLLVEHGNWGEAIRQLADVWLPWMPFRSNRELARQFEVRRLEESDDTAPESVVLRFRPHGGAEELGTHIDAAFSRRDGLPIVWQFFFKGDRSGRLRFLRREGSDGSSPTIGEAVLEDASGKQLARWELVAWDPGDPSIPRLTDGWEGYVQWDRRSERPAVDATFADALEAIHRFEWDRALAALEAAEDLHPEHPLLLLLAAWCHEQRAGLDSRPEILAALQTVASGEAPGLTRFISEVHFPSLEAGAIYEIVRRQPEASRSLADLDRLAHAAMKAERLEDALAHTEAAIAVDGRFERVRRRVELLLRLGRRDAAVSGIDAWNEGRRPSRELAAMGETLAGFGQTAAGEKLFMEALGRDGLQGERRYELLVKLAGLRSGVKRWRALLEAALLKPGESAARRQCLDTILMELDKPEHAEIADELADGADDPQIRVELRLRQAELTAEVRGSAEILWGLFKTERMPDARLAWALRKWNRAGKPDHVIEAAERILRSGAAVSRDVRAELEAAYRAVGRGRDALRAATTDEKRFPRMFNGF